jgi:hypothetical protein
MCQWCEVEERAYRSYEDLERQALKDLQRLREECPGEVVGKEDCPDRSCCLWEKKLEFVIARIRKERLAVEMAGSDACDPEEAGRKSGRPIRRLPAPALSPHLLRAFETYIEKIFDRLTREGKPAPASGRRTRKLIPFDGPGDSPR